MTTLSRILIAGLLLALAACAPPAPDAVELPTLFILPSQTPTEPVADAPGEPPAVALDATGTPTASPTDPAPPTDPPPTFTPSQTITDTPTRTPTPTATAPFVPGLLDELIQTAAVQTVLPPGVAPVVTVPPGGIVPVVTDSGGATLCPEPPAGGFAAVFFADPVAQSQLGCPLAGTLSVGLGSAFQNFQRGQMIWVQGAPSYIYVLYTAGTYQRFVDTWTDGELGVIGEPPPPGLFEPVRGFGKVWRENPPVRDGLGWATNFEGGSTAARQGFERGLMLAIPARGDIVILTYAGTDSAGTWRAVAGGF